ncbi:glycosyltransferase [Infirmifilum sp. SLHALR2]
MALGVNGVSVVTTTFNERDYVGVFVERVRGALRGVRHRVVVVDDSSPDGTYLEAARWADRAVLVRGAGQAGGLAVGLGVARFPVVVTLDVDLENPPELIPVLLRGFAGRGLDLLVASRTWLPRFSERLASAAVGRVVGGGGRVLELQGLQAGAVRGLQACAGRELRRGAARVRVGEGVQAWGACVRAASQEG